MHPKGKLLLFEFTTLCLRGQVLWCWRQLKCYCSECTDIKTTVRSFIVPLLQSFTSVANESKTWINNSSSMLFLLLCIPLTDALQDITVDVLTTYVCMYAFVCIPMCILFKFYMRLMEFCAEDEVGVFPVLSHLQMFPRFVLWTLSPLLGDFFPSCFLPNPAFVTLYCILFSPISRRLLSWRVVLILFIAFT